MWDPSDQLVTSVNDGGACRWWKADDEKRKRKVQEKEVIDQQAQEDNLNVLKFDMQREVAILKRKHIGD